MACCHSLCGILCDMGLRVDAPEFTPGGTVRSPLKSAWCTGVDSVAAQSHGARSFPRQQGVARVQVEPMEVYTPSSGYYSDTAYDDSDVDNQSNYGAKLQYTADALLSMRQTVRVSPSPHLFL